VTLRRARRARGRRPVPPGSPGRPSRPIAVRWRAARSRDGLLAGVAAGGLLAGGCLRGGCWRGDCWRGAAGGVTAEGVAADRVRGRLGHGRRQVGRFPARLRAGGAGPARSPGSSPRAASRGAPGAPARVPRPQAGRSRGQEPVNRASPAGRSPGQRSPRRQRQRRQPQGHQPQGHQPHGLRSRRHATRARAPSAHPARPPPHPHGPGSSRRWAAVRVPRGTERRTAVPPALGGAGPPRCRRGGARRAGAGARVAPGAARGRQVRGCRRRWRRRPQPRPSHPRRQRWDRRRRRPGSPRDRPRSRPGRAGPGTRSGCAGTGAGGGAHPAGAAPGSASPWRLRRGAPAGPGATSSGRSSRAGRSRTPGDRSAEATGRGGGDGDGDGPGPTDAGVRCTARGPGAVARPGPRTPRDGRRSGVLAGTPGATVVSTSPAGGPGAHETSTGEGPGASGPASRCTRVAGAPPARVSCGASTRSTGDDVAPGLPTPLTPSPSPSTTPAAATGLSRWAMPPMNDGSLHEASPCRAESTPDTSCGATTVRCSGGRKVHPAGVRGARTGAVSRTGSGRLHGQRTSVTAPGTAAC
jgi:hypothetical protein